MSDDEKTYIIIGAAAFVLAGTGVGLAALWYFSDRVEL